MLGFPLRSALLSLRFFLWAAGVVFYLFLSAPSALAVPGWSPQASMQQARSGHTATLLADGRLLVVGGGDNGRGGSGGGAELYEAANDRWLAAAAPAVERRSHTATLLPDGQVLVLGGRKGEDGLASAERYDPQGNRWLPAAALPFPCYGHSATLLQNGLVLVVGGRNAAGMSFGAALYDPVNDRWSAAGALLAARAEHTATLLPGGRLLVAGGESQYEALASAELYDPASNSWSAVPMMAEKRRAHAATLLPNGKVLLTGGSGVSLGKRENLGSALLYDPAGNAWAAAGRLLTARRDHTATLLPNGKVQIVGGRGEGEWGGDALSAVEQYDPEGGVWTGIDALNTARFSHTTTLLPNGRLLVVGGGAVGGQPFLTFVRHSANVESFDPHSRPVTTVTASMTAPHGGFETAMLADGRVLVAGGSVSASAEIYDRKTDRWAAAGAMTLARAGHTVTRLLDGRVLVVAGRAEDRILTETELYDPASNTWSAAAPLYQARARHTANLLPDGRVLVIGGTGLDGLFGAEVYDPATNLWSGVWTPTAHGSHKTATLLQNGKLFVLSYNGSSTRAELFDPASKAWTTLRVNANGGLHTATLLADGRVLIAGGGGWPTPVLYDPVRDSWTPTGHTLPEHSGYHSATLLPDGQVLLTRGDYVVWGPPLANLELYDPLKNTWTPAGTMRTARRWPAAILLDSGEVLLLGGLGETGSLASGELFAVAAASVAATAVEFFHAELGHYFITASPDEIASLNAGAAGSGWARTGESFPVASAPASGTVPVCRFYGSPHPGPNSHFYSADASECAMLQTLQHTIPSTQPRWNHEGTAFYVALPQGGACAAGGVPVHRYYNNGHARGVDANHRLVANVGVRGAMAAAGWLYEGVVMCGGAF